jgi:hypothetical protein
MGPAFSSIAIKFMTQAPLKVRMRFLPDLYEVVKPY